MRTFYKTLLHIDIEYNLMKYRMLQNLQQEYYTNNAANNTILRTLQSMQQRKTDRKSCISIFFCTFAPKSLKHEKNHIFAFGFRYDYRWVQ